MPEDTPRANFLAHALHNSLYSVADQPIDPYLVRQCADNYMIEAAGRPLQRDRRGCLTLEAADQAYIEHALEGFPPPANQTLLNEFLDIIDPLTAKYYEQVRNASHRNQVIAAFTLQSNIHLMPATYQAPTFAEQHRGQQANQQGRNR